MSGRVIMPGETIEQANCIRKTLKDYNEALTNVSGTISEIVNDPDLSSVAYSVYKLQLLELKKNIDGINGVISNEMNECITLRSNAGEENLVETVIKVEKKTLEIANVGYKAAIASYEFKLLNPVYALTCGAWARAQISMYKGLVSLNEKAIAKLAKKLADIETIDLATKNLFKVDLSPYTLNGSIQISDDIPGFSWENLVHIHKEDDADIANDLLEALGYINRTYSPLYLWYKNETRKRTFDDIFDFLDFDKGDDGCYHVNIDNFRGFWDALGEKYDVNLDWLPGTWQELGGYVDAYDYIFDIFCDMDADKTDFEYTDKNGNYHGFTVWLWKGEYLNLGAGGECGFYERNPYLPEVRQINNDLRIRMEMTIDYGDGSVPLEYKPEDPTWWATSFNPKKQDVPLDDITIKYTIDFSGLDSEIWEAFINSDDAKGKWVVVEPRVAEYVWE